MNIMLSLRVFSLLSISPSRLLRTASHKQDSTIREPYEIGFKPRQPLPLQIEPSFLRLDGSLPNIIPRNVIAQAVAWLPLATAEIARVLNFSSTFSTLSDSPIELTSVKRKRVLKMSKHKLKKRRRKMKALMRRLGKI
jgi:hypothetical protein